MLDPFFSNVVDDLGPPQRAVPLTGEQDERLSKVLPGSFMAFLRTFGLGDYFNRRLPYCDLSDFQQFSHSFSAQILTSVTKTAS